MGPYIDSDLSATSLKARPIGTFDEPRRLSEPITDVPITASAKKALRQSIRRRAKNLSRSNAYKSSFKQLKKLASGGQAKEAQGLLPKVYKAIDKAAKTGVIKKNKAARLKSGAANLLAKKSAK